MAKTVWIALLTMALAGTAARAEGKNPMVLISTSKGDIKVELYEDKAPVTVKNFLSYVNDGFYDGTVFHRVIPNFMIQGGGFDKDMKQKPTKAPIKNEAGNGLKNDTGTIAMARTGVVDSATAQFFINVKDNNFLNHTQRHAGWLRLRRLRQGRRRHGRRPQDRERAHRDQRHEPERADRASGDQLDHGDQVAPVRMPESERMPGAIIFDLDGVLLDSEGLQYAAYSQVLAPYGVQVSRAEYARNWIAEGRGPEYAVETFGLPLSPAELRARKAPAYQALLRVDARLMPGAIAALTRLHIAAPLGLATNSTREEVEFVMQHFDLRRFFTALITREDYDKAKPEPDAFRTAAARLHRAPAECLVIEDAPRGVLAAHRAGCRVIAVPNEFTRGNDFSLAAAVVQRLDELTVELVERLLGESDRT